MLVRIWFTECGQILLSIIFDKRKPVLETCRKFKLISMWSYTLSVTLPFRNVIARTQELRSWRPLPWLRSKSMTGRKKINVQFAPYNKVNFRAHITNKMPFKAALHSLAAILIQPIKTNPRNRNGNLKSVLCPWFNVQHRILTRSNEFIVAASQNT